MVDGGVMKITSEIEQFRRIVERVFASHYPFGLYTLQFHLLDHLVEDLEKFASISFTDPRPFEHFNILIEQFFKTTL